MTTYSWTSRVTRRFTLDPASGALLCSAYVFGVINEVARDRPPLFQETRLATS